MSEFAIRAGCSEQQRRETFLTRRTNWLKFCLNLIGFVALRQGRFWCETGANAYSYS